MPLSTRSRRVAFLLALTLLILVPFLILSWVNYRASRNWAREEIAGSSLPLTRDTIFSEIHRDLAQPLHVSFTMASDSFLIDWVRNGEEDGEQVIRFLDMIQRRYEYFTVFFVSTQTKKYYRHTGFHKTVSPDNEHDVWFYGFLERGRPYELEVDTDEAADHTLTIFINVRVMDEGTGEVLGVTGVGMKMDTIRHALLGIQETYNRRIFLVDRKGVVQAHPDVSKIRTASILTEPGIADVAPRILASKDLIGDFHYEGADGRTMLTVRFIPEFDWFLIVEQDESGTLASARTNLVRTIALGLFVWIVFVIGFLMVARRQQRRMHELVRTDCLTGLPNRRGFEEDFHRAAERCMRGGSPFCVLLTDLDHFKPVNDLLGHLEGDRLLQGMARVMREALVPGDMVARWGGDEFIFLLQCPLSGAKAVADRIRDAVMREVFAQAATHAEDPRRSVGISGGIIAYEDGMSLDQATHEADCILYASKHSGKHRMLTAFDASDLRPAPSLPPHSGSAPPA